MGGQNDTTEVIDLATGGAESCVSNMLAPHYSENAMGIFVGEKPTICGGWNWLASIPEGYVDCWSLDLAAGTWEQFENLPEIRQPTFHFFHDSSINFIPYSIGASHMRHILKMADGLWLEVMMEQNIIPRHQN